MITVQNLKLSDKTQGMPKQAIQIKLGVLSFLKKINTQKRKKFHISVSRTSLCTQKKIFAHKNVFFSNCLCEYKIRFAVEKKVFVLG